MLSALPLMVPATPTCPSLLACGPAMPASASSGAGFWAVKSSRVSTFGASGDTAHLARELAGAADTASRFTATS